MYIEVIGLEEIDNQEEYEYHERNVRYFKSQLESEIDSMFSRYPHITLRFQYFPEKQKFKEIDIPEKGKIGFRRTKDVSYKLRKWWL